MINQHLRIIVWAYKSKYSFLLWNRTSIPYMSTELKSCLLGILGDNNYYSHYYTYFFFILMPKNTFICKFDTVYRYIVYKWKTCHFTHILHKDKWYIKSIFTHHTSFIVGNHLYIKFTIKKMWLKQKSHCFCIFMSIVLYAFSCQSFMSYIQVIWQLSRRQSLNKLEYFLRPIKNNIFSELLAFWIVCSFTVYVLKTW